MQKFWAWIWNSTLSNVLWLVSSVRRWIKRCVRDHTHPSKRWLFGETEPSTHICRWQIVIVWHTMIMILLLGIVDVNHWWLLAVTTVASLGFSLLVTIDQQHCSFLVISCRSCACHPWHWRLVQWLLLLLVLLVLAVDSLFLFVLWHYSTIMPIISSTSESLCIISLIFSGKGRVIKGALEQWWAFLSSWHPHPSLFPCLQRRYLPDALWLSTVQRLRIPCLHYLFKHHGSRRLIISERGLMRWIELLSLLAVAWIVLSQLVILHSICTKEGSLRGTRRFEVVGDGRCTWRLSVFHFILDKILKI